VIFDTDIFIWVQRKNLKAAALIEKEDERLLSVVSYMELLQGVTGKQHHAYVKDFLSTFGFTVLPLTENVGHRALVYMEEYSLSHGLRATDALVAATATENNITLSSSNAKHFRPIRDLKFKPFHP
jgi:predicted nucleic acid-binding protein